MSNSTPLKKFFLSFAAIKGHLFEEFSMITIFSDNKTFSFWIKVK